MSSRPQKATVFISYSHKDTEFKDQLRGHLDALAYAVELDVWDDQMIDGGEDWYPKIREAMARASMAVCLISSSFLASDFVQKEEVPFLLKRRQKDGLLFLPVLVRGCTWEAHRWLKGIQMLPGGGKSVAGDYGSVPDEAWKKVTDLIHRRVEEQGLAAAGGTKRGFVMVAGRFGLPAFGMEGQVDEVAVRWPKVPDECVAIGRLPQTGDLLFGRDAELTLLDEAWGSDTTHLVSLVAWGGVGKSALVNKWVSEMAADNYRGAERVFAWSFYSQGTGERVTSADLFIHEALKWFGDNEMAASARSPWDKGRRLAELVQEHKTLLLLDGMEPLQSGLETDRGTVKDPALAILLKQLAKKNSGLCVVTTRERVAGLDQYEAFIKQEELEPISPEAGRALLRVGGIRGTDAELEQATQDFGCNAQAVNLLTSYLQGIPGQHVSGASRILQGDSGVGEGADARRVLDALSAFVRTRN